MKTMYYRTMIHVQYRACGLRHLSNFYIKWITKIPNFVGVHNTYWMTSIAALVFSIIWFRKSSPSIEREGERGREREMPFCKY